MLEPIFTDRIEAGRKLAWRLIARGKRPVDLVLALPRGGVPVAYEVARALDAELDVMLVRKLGVPGHEELAMGAIALGGVRVLNDDIVELLEIEPELIDEVSARERIELERRAQLYRGTSAPLDVRGRRVVVVDDGIATGSTMLAALHALREEGAAELIAAAPVAARGALPLLSGSADDVVIDELPEPFLAVGTWYQVFRQISDDEVRQLLVRYRELRQRRIAPQADARG
jgi:predicted phosphoribosyltransferase